MDSSTFKEEILCIMRFCPGCRILGNTEWLIVPIGNSMELAVCLNKDTCLDIGYKESHERSYRFPKFLHEHRMNHVAPALMSALRHFSGIPHADRSFVYLLKANRYIKIHRLLRKKPV